jgi:hypothetical protein
MDDRKRNLKGSESRDKFKLWHKTLSKKFYSCDIDFCFITKYPQPRIIAVLDYKKSNDNITFSEVIAYNHLLECGIPVYIVFSEDLRLFTIWQYMNGDHRPFPNPTVKLQIVEQDITSKQFEQWEYSIRKK